MVSMVLLGGGGYLKAGPLVGSLQVTGDMPSFPTGIVGSRPSPHPPSLLLPSYENSATWFCNNVLPHLRTRETGLIHQRLKPSKL